ncbi:hypothetical protein J6590_072468 [Homalodisca vitripennis]|nr:hypothetical protein J6590_072468 [Homalodisca vitripennis]
MCDRVKSKLKGRVLHSQSREIVSNVYKFMKKEADEKTLSIPLAKARVRTAVATGVSEREISRINKELRNLTVNNGNGESSFLTPNKLKRNRKKPITGLDDFDKALIRRVEYDLCTLLLVTLNVLLCHIINVK